MRKSHIWLIIVSALVLTISVGVTFAYLVTSSETVKNTFTVGHVQLSLTETTGTNYPLIPGTSPAKDPVLTVKNGSEACWLFFKVEKTPEFDNYVMFSVAEGWEALEGFSGVYYRAVDKTVADTDFALLQANKIHIKATLTEQMIAALSESPKITFTGYAVQRDGIATAQDAWKRIIEEGGQVHE